MPGIAITPEFGVVVRCGALDERGVARKDVLQAMEVQGPLAGL
jgi:hypothetical protein